MMAARRWSQRLHPDWRCGAVIYCCTASIVASGPAGKTTSCPSFPRIPPLFTSLNILCWPLGIAADHPIGNCQESAARLNRNCHALQLSRRPDFRLRK